MVRVALSEVTTASMRKHHLAYDVSGGRIERSRRVNQRCDFWALDVAPDGDGEVTGPSIQLASVGGRGWNARRDRLGEELRRTATASAPKSPGDRTLSESLLDNSRQATSGY